MSVNTFILGTYVCNMQSHRENKHQNQYFFLCTSGMNKFYF